MDIIRELADEKMDQSYAKNKMTKETYLEKRRQLYNDEEWEEYEKLLRWHYVNSEKAYQESLDVVARAMDVSNDTITSSANFHGTSMTSLSTITSSLRAQEKNKEPALTKQ